MKTKTGSFSVKAKNAIRLTCFLLIFCVLFSLLTFIFRPNLAEGIHLKQYDTLQDNSLDMIYIGGSVCIVSWMPYEAWNEFGFTSYDVGISSLLAYNFQPLLDEALKTQNPGLIVVDARPFYYTTGHDYEHKYFALVLSSSMKQNTYNNFKVRYNTYKYCYEGEDVSSYFIDMMSFHGSWKSFGDQVKKADNYRKATLTDNPDLTMGFLFVKEWQKIQLGDFSSVTDASPLSETGEQSLLSFIGYLREKNLKALFVVAPYRETEEERMGYNSVKSIVEENGFDFLNANDFVQEMGLSQDADFYNDNHLNVFGAKKYTSFLGEYLREKYSLADHRSDPDYSSWDEGFKRWENQRAAVEENVDALMKSDGE